jgi:MFS family permease
MVDRAMNRSSQSAADARQKWLALLPLVGLFGLLYFVQGMVEPTTGLVAQPLQSQLTAWKLDQNYVGWFFATIAIPWSLKPLFGLLTDFVPILGSRRRVYLIFTSAAVAGAFLLLWLAPVSRTLLNQAIALLVVATIGVAFADVVIDALSVEISQPRGITGQLQSIQWGAGSVATVLVGSLGGYTASQSRLDMAFGVCCGLALVALIAVLLFVREPPAMPTERGAFRTAFGELWRAARSPVVLLVGGFLFLWNFNPFSYNVLQNYATQELGLDEQFFGNLLSIQAAAQIVACVIYGFVCRRIPFLWLVHGSIVAGIATTVAYWGMYDRTSAIVVSFAVGFTYMTATLIQLDLAARVCPVESAGTIFALLMAISNTGLSLSIAFGGWLYEALGDYFASKDIAFAALVGIGAAFTALCWLLVPLLRRYMPAETGGT